MKGLLGFVCFVLISQGVGGLLYTWTDGWITLWALTHRIGFLDGYHVYVDVLLIVLGVAVGTASDRVASSA
jgi:hypothetical protein